MFHPFDAAFQSAVALRIMTGMVAPGDLKRLIFDIVNSNPDTPYYQSKKLPEAMSRAGYRWEDHGAFKNPHR